LWRGESDIDEGYNKTRLFYSKDNTIERETTQQQEEETHMIRRIATTIE